MRVIYVTHFNYLCPIGAHGTRGLCRAILIPSCRDYYKEVIFIMENDALNFVQEQIEYWFENEKLLRQAFTRKSYSEEHSGAYHNEVLEFYGDKVLDFIVTKKFAYRFGELTRNGKYSSEKNEGQLTDLKKRLVNKKMLAHRIDILGFKDALLMGKGDVEQKAQDDLSVKEDLFEAILGTVAIDCNWELTTLEDVVDKMIDIEHYVNNGIQEKQNYVDEIQQWCQKKYFDLPHYEFKEKRDEFECLLWLSEDWKPFRGLGLSKREARMEAAEEAYQYLEEYDMLILPIDEVGEPDIERAINQLQELSQKGYIGEVSYEFFESHDDNGNPIWKCNCSVEDEERYYWAENSSKKQAKKIAAFHMLRYILNTEDER